MSHLLCVAPFRLQSIGTINSQLHRPEDNIIDAVKSIHDAGVVHGGFRNIFTKTKPFIINFKNASEKVCERTLQAHVVMLENGNCFCHEPRFGIHSLQVILSSCFHAKDPMELNRHRFWQEFIPHKMRFFLFSLANEAIGNVVSEQAKEMGNNIIYSGLLPR